VSAPDRILRNDIKANNIEICGDAEVNKPCEVSLPAVNGVLFCLGPLSSDLRLIFFISVWIAFPTDFVMES
jgi:hypothetical protein